MLTVNELETRLAEVLPPVVDCRRLAQVLGEMMAGALYAPGTTPTGGVAVEPPMEGTTGFARIADDALATAVRVAVSERDREWSRAVFPADAQVRSPRDAECSCAAATYHRGRLADDLSTARAGAAKLKREVGRLDGLLAVERKVTERLNSVVMKQVSALDDLQGKLAIAERKSEDGVSTAVMTERDRCAAVADRLTWIIGPAVAGPTLYTYSDSVAAAIRRDPG